MRPRPVVALEPLEHEESAAHRASELRGVQGYDCDVCGEHFDGAPAGSGLFIWTRGDEVRYEDPPLCESCASRVTIGALLSFDSGEEEG